jgi:catalase
VDRAAMQGIKNCTNAEAVEKIANDRETHQRDMFGGTKRATHAEWILQTVAA